MEPMNVPQVAEYLGVHKSTIYRWAQNDKIPHTRVGTWVYCFVKSDIDAWRTK